MTDTTLTPEAPVDPTAGLSIGRVRLRQALALMGVQIRRSLLSRRGLGLYILCLLPVGLLALRFILLSLFERQVVTVGHNTTEFAGSFRFLILPMVVYFGAAAVFTNAVRREVLERTLHFYLLMPVRRDVLMAGLYLGGVVAVSVVVCVSTLLSFVLVYLPSGPPAFAQYLFQGPGLGHLLSYLLLVVVAVAGYGAVFFTLGLFLRRPALPVIAIFGWEWLVPLLPPLLKNVYYLGALMPVPGAEGPFAVLAEYPAPWAAVLGLAVVIAALLVLAGWKARRLEVLYGED